MRPLFLRRSHTPKADSRLTNQPRQKAKGSILWAILGDLMVWSGLVHRELSLDELDPVLADLKRKEVLARARHGNVRCIQEARRARVHKLLAGEVRHV